MKHLLITLVFVVSLKGLAADPWILDVNHSSITFAVDHLMVSEVTGAFTRFEGALQMEGTDFLTAVLEGSIEVGSIDTNNSQRDGHLRAPDFFDSGAYPKISFRSTGVRKVADQKYQLEGNLTIRGVTQPILLDVTFKGTAVFMGQTKTGIRAEGVIRRNDFGLTYNPLLETGGAVIGNEVRLRLNFEFIKKI